jgi:Tetratricopeptide repeat
MMGGIMCASGLTRAYWDSGRLDLASPLYEETFRRRKAALGANHADTLMSTSEQVDEAAPLLIAQARNEIPARSSASNWASIRARNPSSHPQARSR